MVISPAFGWLWRPGLVRCCFTKVLVSIVRERYPSPDGGRSKQADRGYSAQVTGCDDVCLDGVVCGVRWVARGHHAFEEVSAG